MDEKLKELKEKFKCSNKYMLKLSYEDIKELFTIIDFLRKRRKTSELEIEDKLQNIEIEYLDFQKYKINVKIKI